MISSYKRFQCDGLESNAGLLFDEQAMGHRSETLPASQEERRHRLTFAYMVFISLVNVVVFHGVLACGFVSFDDPGYVYENEMLASGLSTESKKHARHTLIVGSVF